MHTPETKSLGGFVPVKPHDPKHSVQDREHVVLVVLDGRRTSRRYEIKKQEFTVGREDTCDLVLHDANCSRFHSKFIFTNLSDSTARPKVALTDLDSRNGTYVNGNRISTKELMNGDKILVGRTLIGFCLWDDVTLRSEDTLLRSASTDSLTGLYNRGFLQSTLTREFHRSRRYGRPLSLVFLDLDHFKQVNDTYGHPVGDKVLVEVSNLLLENGRGGDFACRYGGEEMILILPDTNLEGAALHAQRLRDKLKQLSVSAGSSTVHVTASFGVAELAADHQEPDDLIRKVDSAAYQAKKQGRDRVCTQESVDRDPEHTQPLTAGP